MATSDTEKYVRINLMLVKGGTSLTTRLFKKRVKDLSPPGAELTVEQFLNNNKTTILKKRTGKNYESTIYPPSGVTDIETWDLYLLCFILQEVGNLNYINKKDIEKLQGMRNKLFHLPQPVLNTAVYEERLVKTKTIFTRTCDLIGDDVFKKEIMDIIEAFEKQPIAVGELAMLNHEMNRMESRWLQILDQQDTIINNTEKIISNQAENVSKLLSRLDDIDRKISPNTNVDVPGLPVTIEVKNCPKDKEGALLDCLVNEFQSVIANPECELRKRFPKLDCTVVRDAVVTTFKGFIAKRMHVMKAQNKCLLLTIKCEDISSFVSLVRNCMDGSLLNQLDELRNAVRSLEGCEKVDFELAISENEIISVINDLVTNIENAVSGQDSQIVQQPEQVREVSLDGNGLIHPDSGMLTTSVTIQPSSYQCHEELQNILESEVFQNELGSIQSKARDVTGCQEVEVSIRHTLSANDGNKVKGIFDETVSTTELREEYEPNSNPESDAMSGYIVSELPVEKFTPEKLSDETQLDVVLSGDKDGEKQDEDHHKSTSEVERVGFGIHSVSEQEASSFERYNFTQSSMEQENIAKYENENDTESEFHPGNDPEDEHSSISDDETCTESEDEWFISVDQNMEKLLIQATSKLVTGKIKEAAEDALLATKLLDREKRKLLDGQNTETHSSQLRRWYEDCYFLLRQTYVDDMNATLCYYKSILFDEKWRPGRRHREIVDILLGKLIFQLFDDIQEAFLQELDTLAVNARQRNNPRLCIAIDRDIDSIYGTLSRFNRRRREKCKELRWKEALKRSAQCYLDLECLDDAKRVCMNVLRHFCEYDDVEALEIWSRSLYKTNSFDIALHKCSLALQHCQIENDRERLDTLMKDIQQKKATFASRSEPDEDWLKGTNACQKVKTESKKSSSTRVKKKHKRPKAKISTEALPKQTGESQRISRSLPVKQGIVERKDTQQIVSMTLQEEPDDKQSEEDTLFFKDAGGDVYNSCNVLQSADKKVQIPIEHEAVEEQSEADGILTFFDRSKCIRDQKMNQKSKQSEEEDWLKSGVELNEDFLDQLEDKRKDILERQNFYSDFLSEVELRQKLKESPEKYIICNIHLESSHEALCIPVDSKIGISTIEISGRSKIGIVFNNDQVIVELLDKKKSTHRYGKVIGIWDRMQYKDVAHPVLICTLDPIESNLLLPICKTVPKIHVLDKRISLECKTAEEKMNKLEVYQYNKAEKCLDRPRIDEIKPAERDSYMFLVAYIHWGRRHIYPRGAIIKMIRCENNLTKYLKVLELQYQIPRFYSEETIIETEKMIDSAEDYCTHRQNLSSEKIYVIAKDGSNTFETAFGVEKLDDGFKVSVHVIDVAVHVKAGLALDTEAYTRGLTVNTEIAIPKQMFPEPLCTQLFSLLPNEQRPTISVYMYLSKAGAPVFGKGSDLELRKTSIVPTSLLTFREMSNIISGTDHTSVFNDETKQFVKDLVEIGFVLGTRRREGSMAILTKKKKKHEIVDEKQIENIIAEVLLLANSKVTEKFLAESFSTKYKIFIPLYYQPPPTKENIECFLKIFDSYIHIVEVLQDSKIGTKSPNFKECLGFPDQHKKLMVSKEIWNKMKESPKTAALYIKDDNLHSIQLLIKRHWFAIQQRPEYIGNRNHSNRDQKNEGIIHFTAPLHRYADVLSQRLIHAVMFQREKCPFGEEKVDDMCIHLNSVLFRTSRYEQECRDLKQLFKLHRKPTLFTCIVDEVSEKGLTVCVRDLSSESPALVSLTFNTLDLAYRPEWRNSNKTRDVGSVKVGWKKRIYDFNIRPKDIPCQGNDLILNPHRNVVFVPLHEWARMLQNASEGHNLAKTLKRINVTEHLEGVEDLTTECFDSLDIQPFTSFSLTFSRGQQIQLQLSTAEKSGKLVLKPVLFNVTNNFQICLRHIEDSVKHLSQYATLSTCEKYKDIDDYLQRWLPLLLMESAKGVVRNEESCYINNVPTRFTENKTGKFELGLPECEIRNIELSGTEEDDEEYEGVHCYDWLCLKKAIPRETADSDKRTTELDQLDTVWVGHAEITKVQKVTEKNGRLIVSFSLTDNSPSPPSTFLFKPVKVNVELLRKYEVDRRTESFLKMLKESRDTLASKIALNAEIPELDKKYMDIADIIERDLLYDVSAYEPHFQHLPKNNEQQQKAIDSALKSRFSLIHGPPGTGKTYTGIKLLYLFNEINTILSKEGKNRKQVLFCGPSNKSVDVVARIMLNRMGNLRPNFVRVYGRSIETLEFPVPGRTFQSKKTTRTQGTPARLKSVALHHLIRNPNNKYADEITKFDRLFKDNKYKPMPVEVKKYVHLVREASIDEIRKHDVILCTTAVGSNPKVLLATSVQQVVIDEAGMCPEPQCLVPIIATKAEQVVLIGDHKQLRPIVMCKEAAQLGLETSLFERYASLYEDSPNEETPFTMLKTQYRMHEEICRFPSETFYGGELTSHQSQHTHWNVRRLDIWPRDDKTYYPHVFIHVEGEEKALTVTTEEGNEQSRSNTAEIDHVIKVYTYLEKMIQSKEKIHILSQYNAQCSEIRSRLNMLKGKDKFFDDESVSTVVSSQGGEWDYVIFSTVCSLPDYKIEKNPTLGWCKHNIGFITDPNQVNVALTRAQKGLVIIGNKNLLTCDKNWRELIKHYEDRKCIMTPDEFPPSLPKLSNFIKEGPNFRRQQSASNK